MDSEVQELMQRVDRLRQILVAGVKALRDARNAPKQLIHDPETGLIAGARRVKEIANNADTQQV